MSVEKTADATSFSTVGDEITYTILVTNTGKVPLTNVTIKDPLTGMNKTIEILEPEASQTFTTRYLVTQADLDAGTINNTAFVTSGNPDAPTEERSNEVALPVAPSCCTGFDLFAPANIFLGVLLLVALLLFSLLMGGDNAIPQKFVDVIEETRNFKP